MARRIKTLPGYELNEHDQERVNNLAEKLNIKDGRSLINASLMALEAMAQVAGPSKKVKVIGETNEIIEVRL